MAKIYLQTFGCSLNYADSELMGGLLSDAGHSIVDNPIAADLLVINSCSVKNEAEAKLWRTMKHYPTKKWVVTGCVPQAEPSLLHSKLSHISVIGTNNLNQIIEAVQATLEGEVYQDITAKKHTRLNLPKLRMNPAVEILPINKGCLDNCTYCKTKYARGHLLSYPAKDIIAQAEAAIADGCKEIWLTSQDTGCYGLDSNSSIISLLEQLLSLRGFFRVRLGMMNPNYAIQYLEELKQIFGHPKMFKFLHIPVQSGSNNILRAMQRRYKVEAYTQVVEEIRKAVPNITISTDIIVAFPGETEEDFQQTFSLVQETKPEVLNLSRYWSRPGTPASSMPQILGGVSKDRSIRLKKLHDTLLLEAQKTWLDWEGEVIIDERGTKNSMIGRNDYYKQVVFPNGKFKLGARVKVKIRKSMQYDLRP